MNEILLEAIENFAKKPETQKLTDKEFNRCGYEVAIRRATVDVTPRTLTRKNTAVGTLTEALLTTTTTNEKSFLDEISDYFSSGPYATPQEFDDWHKTVCKQVLKVINEFYTQKNGAPVCYGKAQKIVNMTMKGCYCLKGAAEREAYFTYCHVALDSFILTWYKQRHGYKCKSEWSNLTIDEYVTIQDNIRKIQPDIDLFVGLTPLQAEFLIWPLEIMATTVKEINKCLGGIIDADYASEYFAKHRLGNDLKMAKIILGKEIPDKSDASFISWLNNIPENQESKKLAANYIKAQYGIK